MPANVAQAVHVIGRGCVMRLMGKVESRAIDYRINWDLEGCRCKCESSL